MSLTLYEVEQSLREAKAVLDHVRSNANIMAGLLSGNLHSVSAYRLKQLKKELKDFNMHTEKWKN